MHDVYKIDYVRVRKKEQSSGFIKRTYVIFPQQIKLNMT